MHRLQLPRLGQTMERGVIETWLKSEGEPFEIGDVLYEVQTEKVTVEVEAKRPGTLARIVVPVGEEVPTGTLLAVVADPGETLSAEQVEATIVEGTASAAGGAVQRPAGGRIRAMPLARSMAGKLGIDLATLQGSGGNGTITVEDVKAAAASAGGADGPAVKERRPVRGIARTMAEVVTRSWTEIPQFVQQVSVDASALAGRRSSEGPKLKESHGFDLSYTDLILEAVVRAVREVPDVNASFAGDEIVVYEDVNLSVAIATDAGLVVPVIRRAQGLSLGDLAVRLRELAGRARTGSLVREDVTGGTITASNLGMYGIETGTPIITAPQAAIVFTGAVVDRPVAAGGSVEIRPVMGLAIAYDHRVLDGAAAARFTSALKRTLEYE